MFSASIASPPNPASHSPSLNGQLGAIPRPLGPGQASYLVGAKRNFSPLSGAENLLPFRKEFFKRPRIGSSSANLQKDLLLAEIYNLSELLERRVKKIFILHHIDQENERTPFVTLFKRFPYIQSRQSREDLVYIPKKGKTYLIKGQSVYFPAKITKVILDIVACPTDVQCNFQRPDTTTGRITLNSLDSILPYNNRIQELLKQDEQTCGYFLERK